LGQHFERVVFVAFGGDGLLNEVLNGLERAAFSLSSRPDFDQTLLRQKFLLSTVPCGTGNIYFYWKNNFDKNPLAPEKFVWDI